MPPLRPAPRPQPRPRLLSAALLGGLMLLLASRTSAAPLTSLTALQQAIDGARPGDTLVLTDGVHVIEQPIIVRACGSADAPIVITAATIGGATLAGPHGFRIESGAAWVVIRGFRFPQSAGAHAVVAGASHVRFTRNTFASPGDTPGPCLKIAGDDVEVDYNDFGPKHTTGNLLDIVGEGLQVARRVWIHHNHFHDYASAGANGAETIRLGRSWLSLSNSDSIVEFNNFERCVGENELITNKSGRNIYRYNTFADSPGAQLTLRHGNECRVYGNLFVRTDGLRIFGDRHHVFSNVFIANTKGVQMGNGGAEVADGAALTSHDRPDDVVVNFNTFIDNRVHYFMGGRSNGLGAIRPTFANNLITGGGVAVSIDGDTPYVDPTWSNNLIWQVEEAGDLPAIGRFEADPRLHFSNNGAPRLGKDSPARDAAIGPALAVDVDFEGQPRPPSHDIGADEFSASLPLLPNGHPSRTDVGPMAPGVD